MKIVVCIKQVPATNNAKIDPETKRIVREGLEAILNPFDTYAVEEAVLLREKLGGEVIVLSMGPEKAGLALRECISAGADRAILLSDRAFGGSDTWATSYVLSKAIEKIGDVDLVICGKQAIDGDTAQVGPGVSEFLNCALVTYVKSVKISGDTFTVETQMDEGVDVIEGKMPAVMTVVKEASTPRFASLSGWMDAKKTAIPRWGAKDVGAVPEACGLNGSPTKVVKIFAPPTKTGGTRMDGREEPSAAIQAIVKLLQEKGVA